MSIFKRINWKRVLTVIAVVALLFVGISFVANVLKDDDEYTKVRTSWDIGFVDDEGVFNDDEETTKLTSKKIEIDGGIKIEREFTSGVAYSIVIYDEDDTFLGTYAEDSETSFSDNISVTVDDIIGTYPTAKYFRVVMDTHDENEDITFYEKWEYQTYLDIYTTEAESEAEKE